MCAMSPRLLRPVASGFTPKTLPGLIGWWDANDSASITLNGSNVSEWRDKSGNGFHVTQGTAADQPAYVASSLNGKAGLSWGTAEGNRLSLSRATISWEPRVTYVVADFDGANPFGNFSTLFHHAGLMAGALGSTTNQTGATNWSNLTLNKAASSQVLLPDILSPFFMRATLASSALAVGSLSTLSFVIGLWRGTTTRGWAGSIYEMLVFSASLSEAQDSALKAYIKAKWGIDT